MHATVNLVVTEALFCSVPISIATATSALMKAGFDFAVVGLVIGDGALSEMLKFLAFLKRIWVLRFQSLKIKKTACCQEPMTAGAPDCQAL